MAENFSEPGAEDFQRASVEAGAKFAKLVTIMARLRAPGGCPWDRKQTFDTIKPYLLEETYEVMDAIDQRDWPGLAEELGDLLLQPVFFATMAAEAELFDIRDSLDAIHGKLIRRHPHVFGDGTANTAEDVKRRWDEIKKDGKAAKRPAATEEKSLIDEFHGRFRRSWKPKRSAIKPPMSASNGPMSGVFSTNSRRKPAN